MKIIRDLPGLGLQRYGIGDMFDNENGVLLFVTGTHGEIRLVRMDCADCTWVFPSVEAANKAVPAARVYPPHSIELHIPGRS